MPPSAARLTRMGSISATVPRIADKRSDSGRNEHGQHQQAQLALAGQLMILPPSILASPVRKMAPPTTKSPHHHDYDGVGKAGKRLLRA